MRIYPISAQIPKLLAQFKEVDALRGGVTEGGEDLQCSPLAMLGYPEALKVKDVLKIVDSIPSIEALTTKVRIHYQFVAALILFVRF